MSGPKKLPRDKSVGWVRTGGAIGDPSMSELEEFQKDGAGVKEDVRYCDGDINADLPVKRQPGSED